MNGPHDHLINNRGRPNNARQIGQQQIGFGPVQQQPLAAVFNFGNLPGGNFQMNGVPVQRRVRPQPGV